MIDSELNELHRNVDGYIAGIRVAGGAALSISTTMGDILYMRGGSPYRAAHEVLDLVDREMAAVHGAVIYDAMSEMLKDRFSLGRFRSCCGGSLGLVRLIRSAK